MNLDNSKLFEMLAMYHTANSQGAGQNLPVECESGDRSSGEHD